MLLIFKAAGCCSLDLQTQEGSMKKRLRKQKRIGEFQELGFSEEGDVRAEIALEMAFYVPF